MKQNQMTSTNQAVVHDSQASYGSNRDWYFAHNGERLLELIPRPLYNSLKKQLTTIWNSER